MRARTGCEILAAEGYEVSSLQLSLGEPLSPELALVCPELAERARSVLPEPGWLAPAVRIESAPASRLEALALRFFFLLVTVTPLVLVLISKVHTAHH